MELSVLAPVAKVLRRKVAVVARCRDLTLCVRLVSARTDEVEEALGELTKVAKLDRLSLETGIAEDMCRRIDTAGADGDTFEGRAAWLRAERRRVRTVSTKDVAHPLTQSENVFQVWWEENTIPERKWARLSGFDYHRISLF